jgi:hypothetical protein
MKEKENKEEKETKKQPMSEDDLMLSAREESKVNKDGKKDNQPDEEGTQEINYDTFDPLAMLENDEEFLKKVDPLHF